MLPKGRGGGERDAARNENEREMNSLQYMNHHTGNTKIKFFDVGMIRGQIVHRFT